MDEMQTLEALGNILTEIAERPYDITLRSQQIRLAQSADMQEEVQNAREMLVEHLAAGEETWLPLLEVKEASVDTNTAAGIEELLELYERAEEDYQSIPILLKHLNFILDRYARYAGDEIKTDDLGDMFSTEWTRQIMVHIVAKGITHMSQGYLLWDAQRDWELERLATASEDEKETLIAHVAELHLSRLRQPHSTLEETFQSYSSFTTNYKPPQEYESLLVAASKIRAVTLKTYDRREGSETALKQFSNALSTFAKFISAERRNKVQDVFVLQGVYERAVSEAAKRRFEGEAGAEETLRMFWTGYIDALRINGLDAPVLLSVLHRAVRSVPYSGEVWARYLRYVERVSSSQEADIPESVADLYTRVIDMRTVQTDVEEIVPLVLARAGYQKRLMEAGEGGDDVFAVLVALIESGIEMVQSVAPTGDPRLRLEKYLSEIYLRLASAPDLSIKLWQSATKFYKSSYLAWTCYTEVLIQQDKHALARSTYKNLCGKSKDPLDWPEAIWEAWISFEHLYGSADELDECLDLIEKHRGQVNVKRAKEAEKAAYQAMQITAEAQASIPVADAVQSLYDPTTAETVPNVESGTKRKAEDIPSSEANKRPRTEDKPAPLKRDRENSTVFVASLPTGVTEDDLRSLFKDCGKVREIKITQLTRDLVATVEFTERETVPAALTKDKKKLLDQEVAVHLAWKSTLYVTNFPESADDAFMRDLFGKFGTIFDVRWPSKKFKNTRRFCYVQYTSPVSASNALELHGKELEPGQVINVFVSNPERKKERSDQDANEREIYVAGLSKFTTKIDLEKLFRTYGGLKEVRMATEKDGISKGFAFVEFDDEQSALAALAANNHELKKRRIAVTMADSRVRARNRNVPTDAGLSKRADEKNRSVRIRNLPAGTQEGLLQQTLEKVANIRRVELFEDIKEAVVELENPAEAGKLLLRTEPIVFNGNTLALSEEGRDVARSRPPPAATVGMFVPRTAVSRPRAGLGPSRKLGLGAAKKSASIAGAETETQPSLPSTSKGQDDFRNMLK